MESVLRKTSVVLFFSLAFKEAFKMAFTRSKTPETEMNYFEVK